MTVSSAAPAQPIRLYRHPLSGHAHRVELFLSLLGLPYELADVDLKVGEHKSPAFLAKNPFGRVPVIEDGDVVVWESQAILRYLAARYGQGRFWSDDPAERAQVDRWMDWSQTALQPDFLNGVFWGYYRTPDAQRNTAAIARNIARCAQHFRRLDTVLATQPFLCGTDLTLADIPAGTSLYRYFELDIERPDVPHVVAWYQQLQERPAFREHIMVPFSELRGKLDY